MASFLPKVQTTTSPSVTDDEFKLFHSIDRRLYTRLIFNLGRDRAESMQVMAFWMWLEQEVVDNLTLVSQMLSIPSPLLNDLANESVKCLNCVEGDTFPYGEKTKDQLVLLPSFVERNISFHYFYENRIGVLRGVSKMIGQVCSRAFRGLHESSVRGTGFLPVVPKGSFYTTREKQGHGGVRNQNPKLNPLLVEKVGEKTSLFGEVGNNSNNIIGNGVMNMVNNVTANPYRFPGYNNHMQSFGSVIFPMTGGISRQLTEEEIMENELCYMLNDLMGENDGVCPDERTIFLTFSKGYPISEIELRDFFTRKFGDFIETIHMQEVPPNEQVLYARVVAKSSLALAKVVEGGKAKYTINGKHVWARNRLAWLWNFQDLTSAKTEPSKDEDGDPTQQHNVNSPKAVVSDSIMKVLPFVLKMREFGEEMAITMLVSGNLEFSMEFEDINEEEIKGVFYVYLYFDGYVPFSFVVQGNGVCLDVVELGRDVSSAKYLDFVS
ncbi:hypothetical protein ACH5RR_018795 [Cinchona calisaya]|uniref:NTF2 domain-containing protein n=1 Tax=Cinchona calisaya TaxID=153742 RepID=A0ABD2ZP50_9GENT